MIPSDPTPDNMTPDDMTPDDIAADWLLRRDAGLDVERDDGFRAWHDADPGHAAAWAHAVAVWDMAASPPADDPLIAALRRDALQARPARPPVFAFAAAAAAAVAVLGVALSWPQVAPLVGPPWRMPGPPPDAAATFAAGQGAPDSVTLADGSRLTLDAGSAIAVAYDDRRRAVRLLRGQAFVRIAPDAAARPFVLAAGERAVHDLGTAYNVRLQGDAVTVTLMDGAVDVRGRGGHATTLAARGDQVTAKPGAPDVVVKVDPDQAQAWRTPMLEFAERPLAEAVAEINRYGGAPARVTDPSIASLRVSGRFRAGDPTRFARVLAAAYPLRVTLRSDGGADISGR